MGTALRIQASLGHAQPLYWTSADEVLFNDNFGVFGAHVSVPDSLGIDHHHGSVFALIEAAGFINPYSSGKSRIFCQLRETRVQIALSICCAGRARRVGGTHIVANKDMVFKSRQAVILLNVSASRLNPGAGVSLKVIPIPEESGAEPRSFHNLS